MTKDVVRQKILALREQAALEDLAAYERIRKKRQALEVPPDATTRLP